MFPACHDRPPSASRVQSKPAQPFRQLFQCQWLACYEGLPVNFGAGNIRILYEFLMKFNVSILVRNFYRRLRKGRSMLVVGSADMPETFH